VAEDTPVSHGRHDIWYVVDYDLPDDYRRLRFYRAVKKWLRDRGSATAEWSTFSVVITKDWEFAEFVYDTAVSIGRAHLYEARQIR